MRFVRCEFNESTVNVPFSTFERCTFNITELDQLPAAWQCVDCTVNYDGNTFSFGQSQN